VSRLRSQRGFGAIAVILALLIVALVYLGYHQMQDAMQAPRRAVTTIDASKAFACKTNRQTAEREVQMWLVSHPGETPTWDAVGSTAHCPEGGEYRLEGLKVLCSKHE
jgi:Tfp pilus assembly protein PilX